MSNSFEDRLSAWKKFRLQLETAADPILLTVSYWNSVPTDRRNIDPYDQTTWPDPWEMIEENSYCEFTKLLAVAYTVMFTDRFKNVEPIFSIGVDNVTGMLYYTVRIDDVIVSLDEDNSMCILEHLPKTLRVQKTHLLKNSY